MSTRTTERRIPPGYAATDLGETAGDATAVLIGYHSSPLVVGRRQTCVVFVLDGAMQPNVASLRWQAGGTAATTTDGVFEFLPTAEGDLPINVDLLDGGGGVLKSLLLTQQVGLLNPELESMMRQPGEVSPVAADPETSRELVNDVRGYIDALAPRSADPDSSLNRLMFAIAYAEAFHVPPPDRSAQMEQLAASLGEGAAASFIDQAEGGIGLCQIRPHILAMYIGATATGTDRLIAPREFPREEAARRPMRRDLKAAFAALDPAVQADVYNLLRFPKSNLRMALKLIEALRTQYFGAATVQAILGNEDNAMSLISEFKEGPFALA